MAEGVEYPTNPLMQTLLQKELVQREGFRPPANMPPIDELMQREPFQPPQQPVDPNSFIQLLGNSRR